MTVMPIELSSFDALRNAHKGVEAGLAKLAEGAQEVQRASLRFTPEDSVSFSEQANALAAGENEPSLHDGLMDMRVARYAVLANMASMRASDELLQEAVKIARRSYWVVV